MIVFLITLILITGLLIFGYWFYYSQGKQNKELEQTKEIIEHVKKAKDSISRSDKSIIEQLREKYNYK